MRETDGHAPACLTVVMPCFNEATTVERVMHAVLASPYVAELIVVDDASWDGTVDVVREVRDPRIKLLCQPYNQGKGAALRRGFREATSPFVVVQDADLEYDPAEFGALLAPLLDDHADVVYGSRFQSGARRVLFFWHSIGNQFLTLLSNMMTNLNLTDMETGYKVFRREVLDALDLREDRFGIEPEITAKVAAGRWRVYEVPISYHGRSYAEGKKIGWRDGVRAIYCILRYSPLGQRVRKSRSRSVDPGDQLDVTLEELDGASRYAAWITDLIRPYVGGRVLEVGAGHGTYTSILSELGTVTAAEPEPRFVDRLRRRFAGDDRVEVVAADANEVASRGTFDSIVLLNVLEHIEDDVTTIKQLAEALAAGGHIVVYSPALPALYSDFDRRVGHHRRYTTAALEAILTAAGLEVVECRYVNRLGAIAWFVVARLLGQQPTRRGNVRLFDAVGVPLARLTERHPAGFGQSVLAVGRSPSPQ